ncbi:hypothetical protein F2Q70_00029327 [Brassica cretica]|uniref:SWIM-type domain-containing protein n=1 Tax=Brassica cretica TaxID=69181 RepID=A0A8S9FKG8_BRACR|nr:hypothetical protein F2Q70_00029327 [Brassica cretica]
MNRHKKPPWPGDHRRLAHKPKLELKIWIQGIVLLDMAGIRYDSDDFVKTIVLVCGGSIWQQGSIQNHECLVMKAGSSIQKGEFDSYMKEIKEKKPEGWKWLERIPPHQWALAHDSGLRYGVMKIDRKALFAVCRSFQKVAMTGGVMLLFSEMKDAFDSSFSSSRGSLHRGDLYAKNVMKKFQESLTDSSAFVVKPLERDAFQVSVPLEKKERMSIARWHLSGKFKEYKEGIVQLNDSTCTCGKFQRQRFPCLHALAVCKKMKINPLQYADDCYSAERYYKTYEATFSPVPTISAWPDASGVPTLFPPVIAPPPLKVSGNKSQRSELNRFESTRT